jgi:two-component system, LuxR family, sensor kinase FixL
MLGIGPWRSLRMRTLSRQFLTHYGPTLGKVAAGARSALSAAVAGLPNAATAATLLIAYVGLEWVSFIHEHRGVPVTPWNPGIGVAFALLVLKGAAYGLVMFVGVIVAEIFVLRTELAWPVIVAVAALASTSFAAAAAVARRHLQLDVGLIHVRDVLVLLAVGAAAAAAFAVLLSALLITTDELTLADLTQSAVPLLVGDIIGIAVVTPLVFRLALHWTDVGPKMLMPLVPEIALHLLAIATILWMAVGSGGGPNDYKLLSLLFLPVVAAALRHGIDGSCAALGTIQLGLVGVLHQHGYDATEFTEFQVVMLILTMSGLLVGVVVSERQRADRAAREAEARLKEMQAQAGRAARMNLVSGMASALAHEINQPMTAARALARSVQQILHAPAADTERANTNIRSLVAQIDHASGVVRRMRDFLRRGQPHFSTLDIATVVDDALVLANPDAAANRISIAVEVDEGLPPVFGDHIQLQQVVLNLMHNAVEAITESRRAGGHIRISARRSVQEPAIEIAVSDNGSGVSPDLPLFQPLTSSKPDGLGLGLSICASIVQAHGGRIWLQSSTASGTEFRFALPLQAAGPA